MLSELWTLIKLLFQTKPSDIKDENDLKIIQMKHFPFGDYTLMSWCGKIISKEDREFVEKVLETEEKEHMRTHEYGHVVQAQATGNSWIKFYASYYWNWLLENPIIAPASSAYYTNPYEVEAYTQDCNPEYWKNYTKENLFGKYSLKNGKNLYRCNRDSWYEFVKNL